MKRLDDAHCGPPGPKQLAWGGRTKGDWHIAKLDCTATGIGVHDDFGGYGVGETQIVCGGHTVDKHPRLVAAPDGVDDGARIRRIWFLGEFVEFGLIVKAVIDPPEDFGLRQSLQCLVDGVPRRQIDEITGCPTLRGSSARMRPSIAVFRSGESLFMSENGSTSDNLPIRVRN